jgi:subtilase family serine protease
MTNNLREMVTGLVLFFLLTNPAPAAGRKMLQGNVPTVVIRLGLQPVGRLPAETRLNLAIGLPLRNKEALNSLIQQLYDPGSPKYRRFLTPDQFTEMFGPSVQDYQVVVNFAKTNGLQVVKTYGNRALLDVAGNVSDIERALHITILTYQHPTEPRLFFAPDREPSVDANVPILAISGLNNFYLPRPASHRKQATAKVNPAGGSAPDGYSYMGSDFRNAYVPGVTLTGSGQEVGLVEFDGYYTNDITSYEDTNGLPHVPMQNVLLNNVSGNPSYVKGNVAEVSLDIEMAVSMAPGLAKVVVFEGTSWDSILNSMAASNQIKQFSASWIWGSPDTNADQAFQQMITQGQSFFQASGDGDAYAGAVLWPADDPYLTSVGGTELTMSGSGASYTSETVWNLGDQGAYGWPAYGNGYVGSGGGVSTYYSIPSWQQGVNMASNGGSTAYRNVPDVALTADDVWVIYFNGLSGSFWGTSCAAPLWAGFTALVNQRAAANGQSSVGFLNPALYAIGQGPLYSSCFHDTTTGNNTNSLSPNQFYAAGGYDLCTGWGTPNGMNLINALIPYGDVWVDFNYTGGTQNGTYNYPFKTLAQGTNAVAPGGNIWIRTSGSSSETMVISKPLSIRAYSGPATVGN